MHVLANVDTQGFCWCGPFGHLIQYVLGCTWMYPLCAMLHRGHVLLSGEWRRNLTQTQAQMEGKGAIQPRTPSSLLTASGHHANQEHSSWSPRRCFQDRVTLPPIHFSGLTSPSVLWHMGARVAWKFPVCSSSGQPGFGGDHPLGSPSWAQGGILRASPSLVPHRGQRDGGGDSSQVTEGDEERDVHRLES